MCHALQRQPNAFFITVLSAAHTTTPRGIPVDKNAAYPKALHDLKSANAVPQLFELQQFKYLNNLLEHDHRFIKRVVKPGLGFFAFEMAWHPLQGYKAMHMIRKGQVHGVAKGSIQAQTTFIASLFGMAACVE